MKKILTHTPGTFGLQNRFCYQLSAIIICSCLLISCTHYYYVPPTQNIPLFKEKNEIRVNANISNDIGTGTDIQVAYAFSKQFAVMANYSTVKDEVDDANGKGNYFDMAIGYYKPIQKHFVFEVYGGIGKSNQSHQYADETYQYYEGSKGGTSELSFIKAFIQPSFGITTNGFDAAVALPLSNVSFGKIKNNTTAGSTDDQMLKAISTNKNAVFFEPSFTIRGGWKYLKIQLQVLASKKLNDPELSFFDYRSSVGLSFAFAERFKQKK
nr:hypothetical protein [uncultured Lacibacter sp.]